nr:TRAP transporter substrate-binding protein DctP [Clostridium novyi]
MVYDSGKLGDERSVIEQVQFGGIDFARIDMFSINEFSKDISLFAIPYAIKNLKHMWDVMDSQVGVNIKKDLLKERFKCMCVYEPSSRCFYTCRHKIKSIKDLKGLKIRTQQSKSIVDVMDNIGIKSVFLGEDSIYDSIEEGLIDGAEDNVVMYYKSRNYEIAKFAMIDNHFRIPEMIIANKVTMSGLSKEDQELIEQAAKDSARLEQCLIRIQEKKAINYMLRRGVTIKNIDDKSKEEFIRNNKQYYENFDKKRINYILGRIKE